MNEKRKPAKVERFNMASGTNGVTLIHSTTDRFGFCHSFDDEPAMIFSNETQEWWRHGDRHRTTGPALVYTDQRKNGWWINGMPYRDNEQWMTDANVTKEEMVSIVLKYGNVGG